MNSKRCLLAIVVSSVAAVWSFEAGAADTVVLPATAKPLTKAGLTAAYAGKNTEWSHPNTDKATGTATFDAPMTSVSGKFQNGKDNGEWEGKISWKGDEYCYQIRPKGAGKFGKPVCNFGYQDGNTVYEVDPKSKKVLSVAKLK